MKTLRARRLQLDLTMDELADAIGYNQASISRWEEGHTQPRATAVLALCSGASRMTCCCPNSGHTLHLMPQETKGSPRRPRNLTTSQSTSRQFCQSKKDGKLVIKVKRGAAMVTDARLTDAEVRVGLALLLYFHNTATGRCFPSYPQIAELARVLGEHG